LETISICKILPTSEGSGAYIDLMAPEKWRETNFKYYKK